MTAKPKTGKMTDKELIEQVKEYRRVLHESWCRNDIIRLEASEEREKIRKQFEEYRNIVREKDSNFEKQILDLRQQVESWKNQAEHFKELYGKMKRD